MDETKVSGANRLWQHAANRSASPILVAAPKEYFLGPVFAASKQTGSREITIGDHRYQIGGFHPLRPDMHPPALDFQTTFYHNVSRQPLAFFILHFHRVQRAKIKTRRTLEEECSPDNAGTDELYFVGTGQII